MSMTIRLSLTPVLFTLLFAAKASAKSGDPWRKSFQPEVVATYLDSPDLRLVVVAADDAAQAAARALIWAFNESGGASVVLDARSLGRVEDLGDPAIIEMSRKLPVDRIAIVRAFGAAEQTAVVTVYNPEGEALQALNAKRGEPLAENRRRSKRPNSVVGAIVGGMQQDNEAAQEEYERRAVWLQGITRISANQYGAWSHSWEEPRLGKYGKSVSWPEFFELVGRADLTRQIEAAESSSQRTGGSVLQTLGMLSFAVGGSVALTGVLIGSASDGDQGGSMTKYGAIIGLGGIAAFVGGRSLVESAPQYPQVEPHEVREMVDTYNSKLKQDLGLAQARRARPAISLAPVLGHRTGGLVLSGSF